MFLNNLQSTYGARKKSKRVGRGIGSTLGKTCGRGHKGQKARSGGFHKIGFEGGQMPLQRRLPKVGFNSAMKKLSAQVTLSELSALEFSEINIAALVIANIVSSGTKKVKIISSGSISKAIDIKGIKVTKGARLLIEKAGGKIEV